MNDIFSFRQNTFFNQSIFIMQEFFFQPATSFDYNSLKEQVPIWVSHSIAWVRVIESAFPQMRGYVASDSQTISEKSSFLPIYRVRRPMKKSLWLSIPFSTICDPIIKDRAFQDGLLQELRRHPLTQKAGIEIRAMNAQMPVTCGYTSVSGYINHQLQLKGDEQEIFARFHKKSVQARIRQSMKAGLKLIAASNMDDVKAFYNIYVQMRKEQGLPPQPYRFFTSMWKELSPTNNIDLLLAEKDGQVIAGSWALKNSWLYSLEYLARAGKNDKLRCAYFLNWHGIKRALAAGIQTISFARTSAKNEGLNKYKSGWATQAVPYNDLVFPTSEVFQREDRFSYHLIRKYSSSLPTPLFRMLGELIYRII